MLPLGAVAVAPLIGGLIKNPHKPDILLSTPAGIRRSTAASRSPLTRDDGTKIRPEDVSVGGQMTVFPGIYDPARASSSGRPTTTPTPPRC